MSRRPISIDELLKDESGKNDITNSRPTTRIKTSIDGQANKLVFLSKAQREKLAIQKKLQQEQQQLEVVAKYRQSQANKRKPAHDDYEEEKVIAQVNNTEINDKKKRKKKFNFGWDEDEDTSNNYQPLILKEPLRTRNPDEMIINDKHWSEKKVEDMTIRDWRIFKEDFSINSRNVLNDIKPLRVWDEIENLIPARILTIIHNLEYLNPTPIQRASIPIALNSQDAIGIAKTGSGKTLAFLIPLLTYMLNIDDNYFQFEHTQQDEFNKPLSLILVPTRELALQITKEANKFCQPLGINVISIIGGHQYEETINSIQNGGGVHIVVATPGRLIDSLERHIIDLSKCYHLIMDEADRMIDMGFEASLTSIFKYLPTESQLNSTIDSKIFKIDHRLTLMFTATITPTIEKITKNYLRNPAYITIGNADEANDSINQEFEYITTPVKDVQELDDQRFSKLLSVITKHQQQHHGIASIIIFANYKKVCDALSTKLSSNGWKDNVVIHGSKNQESREWSINNFRNHESRVLIATDVAARGIDVSDVSLVVNFQMVTKFEEYIHRIGRTGRAGKTGLAYTFIDDSNKDIFLDLKKFLSRSGNKCPDWLLRATQSQSLRD